MKRRMIQSGLLNEREFTKIGVCYSTFFLLLFQKKRQVSSPALTIEYTRDRMSNHTVSLYFRVSLTITPERKINEIRLGNAIRAFIISEKAQTVFIVRVAPT